MNTFGLFSEKQHYFVQYILFLKVDNELVSWRLVYPVNDIF